MKLRGLFAAVLLGGAVIAAAQAGHKHDMASWKSDSDFAKKMSMHHRMGIAMNDMCQQKASHAELKQLCGRMTDGQKKDIAKMQAIPALKMDSAAEKAPHHGMGDMHQAHKMDDDRARMHHEGIAMHQKMMEASGDKFDSEFLKNMSKHHEQAIKMSEQCEQKGENGELKKLCTEMKASQEAERKQMSSMLSQWYPKESATTAGANTPTQ